MIDKTDERPWSMPVPELGRRYLGLGRSASYAAAANGEIPVMRIGGKLVGLPRVLEDILSGRASPASSRPLR